MEWINFWTALKEWLLTTLGHAVSGFGTAALYELSQLYASGVYDVNGLMIGALIGGSIGFFKTIVIGLENLKKEQGFAVAGKPKKSYFY